MNESGHPFQHRAAGPAADLVSRHSRERSIAEILNDIIGEVQGIERCELELAKAEISGATARGWESARLMIVGVTIGLFGIAYLLLSAVYALARVMPAWAAAGCVGLTLTIGAGTFIVFGLIRWKHVHPAPRRTIDNIKEDVAWLKNQVR